MRKVSEALLLVLRGCDGVAGSVEDGARLFVEALFLASAIQQLVEREWLMSRDSKSESFPSFVARALERELAPFGDLGSQWSQATAAELKTAATRLKICAEGIVRKSASMGETQFRPFVRAAVSAMAEFCAFEESWRGRRESDAGLLPASLYRAFDPMDGIFQLDYEPDSAMKTDPAQKERLYEGGGRGVQTSYAQIFTVLAQLNLPKEAHLVDLGSGYGRVGLIAGLLRSDLKFTGYEYVEHRVTIARAAASRAGLGDDIRFFRQDLASSSFEIPEADVYYLYDPFTDSTYERVLKRVFEVGRRRPVAVVTKGASGDWLRQASGEWTGPEPCDGGTILIFRSRGA